MQNELKALGFTTNDIKVYLALLSTGKTQAGNLIKKTKLHRMIVYTSLQKFIDEGLVSTIQTKNIKSFIPNNPNVLLRKTQALQDTAEKLIPRLTSLMQNLPSQIEVKTYDSKEGLFNNLCDIINSFKGQKDKTMRIIGGGKDSDFYNAIEDYYEDYIERLAQNKITKHLLAPEAYSTKFKAIFIKEQLSQLRILPDGYTAPSYTRIGHDIISIEIYKPNLTVIQIKNKALADSYKESYDLLWKSAKGI